jgi:hypothetical protein
MLDHRHPHVRGAGGRAVLRGVEGFPLQWRKSARRYVPPHWQTIRERHSPLSDSARRAVDPANAILNYAYGVLESQCRPALAAEGFDLGCGFLHAD